MVLKVLLVEDDLAWQQAIEGLLALDGEFELVAKADDYESALEQYEMHQPEIVLLDWKINQRTVGVEKDGLLVGQEIQKKGHPPHQVVLISGSSPDEIPENDFLYVPKSRIAQDLPTTLAGIKNT